MDEQIIEDPQQDYGMYPPISGGMGGMPRMDSKADLLEKIKPELAIETIKQKLMGREWNEQKHEWVPNLALKKMALTEEGATAITNLMFPASSQNVSLSNLKDEEIKKRMLSIIKTAMKMCLDNVHEYGITSSSQYYFIRELIHTNTLVVLKQSENEGIRRLINSTISENRNYNTMGEEKKGGILGLFRR